MRRILFGGPMHGVRTDEEHITLRWGEYRLAPNELPVNARYLYWRQWPWWRRILHFIAEAMG